MLESSDYLHAMSKTHGKARLTMARKYRQAVARERVQRVHLPSDTLWSSRGDLEAVAGIESSPITPSPGWKRLQRDGAIVVDSAVLGERVVVKLTSSTPVPPQYADLAHWTLPELRRIRDTLRSGPFKFAVFESINRAKRMLGGTLVSTSNKLLAGEIVSVQDPGSPLAMGMCMSSSHSRHCTTRIAAGEFTAFLAPDGDGGPDPDPVPVCQPCSIRYSWSPAALRARRAWAKTEGVQL